jgi:hypothetical protein
MHGIGSALFARGPSAVGGWRTDLWPAGEVAALVASDLGVDCVLTGHSLGRNKKEHLMKSGAVG